jgi:flagellin
MTRINTNIGALRATYNLQQNNRSLNTSLERLSTGFKINRASDNPAGLVISEKLRSQITGLKSAVENTEKASNILNTTEGALNEVNTLLMNIKALALEAANDGALSQDEIDANQSEIDSAVATINRVANTTSFGTTRLLDGTRDYITSGVSTGYISEMKIYSAGITNENSNMQVNITITQNASQAILSNTTSGIGVNGATLLVSGNKGSSVLEFSTSAANSAIVAAVNGVTDNTGVTAVVSGGALLFKSQFYGKSEFVTVKDIKNLSSTTRYMNARDEGANLSGTINGLKIDADGLTLKTNTYNLTAEITLSSTFFTALTTGATSATSSFYITGGGFAFNIGNDINANNKAFVGLQRMTSENLGDRSVGFLNDITIGGAYDLSTNPEQATEIIEAAIDDVTRLRARIGAMVSNTFESNLNSLNESMTNLQESESRIRDTDFAAETATFTRNQILVQAATAMLAQANVTPQSVLQLLA